MKKTYIKTLTLYRQLTINRKLIIDTVLLKMRSLTILSIVLLTVGCSIGGRCGKASVALRSLKLDSEGYLPRDKVFLLAHIKETDLIPLFTTSHDGFVALDCGCWLKYRVRFKHPQSISKTIDEIINNPDRTTFNVPNQLESVVIIDRKGQELLRLDSKPHQTKR